MGGGQVDFAWPTASAMRHTPIDTMRPRERGVSSITTNPWPREAPTLKTPRPLPKVTDENPTAPLVKRWTSSSKHEAGEVQPANERRNKVVNYRAGISLISLGSPHARYTPMGRMRGEPNEIGLTAIGVELNG